MLAQMVDQQSVRANRAQAARILLSMHSNDQLHDPTLWTWGIIDRIPPWCLLDGQALAQLQDTCGALLLAPEVRLWIDGPRLKAAAAVVTEPVFLQVIALADKSELAVPETFPTVQSNDQADSHSGNQSGSRSVNQEGQLPQNSTQPDLNSWVKSRFASAGSAVLRATLDPVLPGEMLTSALASTSGQVSENIAQVILSHAQSITTKADSS